MRLAALSIDLDEIGCYTAIHGLPPPEGARAHAVYRNAVPRFEDLLERLSLHATFFAIGRDLSDSSAAATIARLHAAGHEIGNHTFHHRYDFTRQDEAALQQDIRDGASAIEASTHSKPTGFRAPGYTIVDSVFEALHAQGYSYDSSVFPCPPYYAAKALAIGGIALRRRKSHSIIDDPRVLGASADPYRVGKPYHRKGAGLLELPIGVTQDKTGRLPFIGTSLALAGERGAAWLTRRIVGRPLVNLELHGIDLCDAAADDLQFLAPHQPDLRRTLDHKRRALESAIWVLRGAGYRFVTLAEAAKAF